MFLTILVFILILSVLVLIHEAGHFFMAKKFGIKVEEFGFGLPPRIFGKKIGETIYSLNWLPIGGFVKLYGEDDAGAGRVKNSKLKIKSGNIGRAFFARPAWQRAMVIGAGVAMNFLLAVVIISYLFGVVGVGIPGNKVIVAGVAKDAPAYKAGFMVGDVIENINGVKIIDPGQLIEITKNHLGKNITVKIIRDSKEKILNIEPRKTYPTNEGPMGIAITQNVEIKKYPWYEAPIVGTKEALKNSWLIIEGLGTVVYGLFVQGALPKDVAGPIGIAQLTGQVVTMGTLATLSFVSLLSLNLAILNILPIPALDGGRLFFIIIEAVTRKKVNQRFEAWAHTVGMVILLTLIAVITVHDLIRVITGQPILPKP
ncbi:MAG: M50 family metallopeptidase [Candidatus Levybacteria bacterium]|nr:M50 family metallopeptidase [Candidatus Levybacteria bacterium]